MQDSNAFSPLDLQWMAEAISLAKIAEKEGEVPVGAIIVHDDQVLGKGWNQTISHSDPTAHAEILALRAAGERKANYRLPGCTLYVTLEPCCMCAGAIVHARLDRVVYGATDPKTGAAGGVFSVLTDSRHNQVPAVSGGCLAHECSEQLKHFFRKKRKKQA